VALSIRLLESLSPNENAYSAGSSALDLSGESETILRFAIEDCGPEQLEALRHARRSMLREEWTRGRDGEEPSLDDAVFSPADICWRILPGQRSWCLQKVRELTLRANRCLSELGQTAKANV
jgi:hypothetical protein